MAIRRRTVALAEGRRLDVADGGQLQSLGHVERDAEVLAALERLAEAGHLLAHHVLEPRAACRVRRRHRAPLLHVAQAPRQAHQRVHAVHGRRRRRRAVSAVNACHYGEPCRKEDEQACPCHGHCRLFLPACSVLTRFSSGGETAAG